MNKLLSPRVQPDEELVRDLPAEIGELISNIPGTDGGSPLPSSAGTSTAAIRPADLIEAAHQVAEDLHARWSFPERLAIYREVAEDFGSDARRVLNIAAARWPELVPIVNDQPEWKALLSADLG